MLQNQAISACVFVMTLLLTGCGGGGGDTTATLGGGGRTNPGTDIVPDPTGPGDNGTPPPVSQEPDAANPQLAAARFYRPRNLAFDQEGNLYVMDRYNTQIIDSRGHDQITRISLDGSVSLFGQPSLELSGLALDSVGNAYAGVLRERHIRRYAPDGSTSIFSLGEDFPIALGANNTLIFDSQDNLYTFHLGSSGFYMISPQRSLTRFGYADGPGTPVPLYDGPEPASFSQIQEIVFDAEDNLYVLDRLVDSYFDVDREETVNACLIRKIDRAAGTVTTIAGQPALTGTSDSRGIHARWGGDASGLSVRLACDGIAADPYGTVYLIDNSQMALRRVALDGTVSTLYRGSVSDPFAGADIAVSKAGNVYVSSADRHVIYKFTPDGQIRVFAGKLDEHDAYPA